MAQQTINTPRETTHQRIATSLETLGTASANNPTNATVTQIVTGLANIVTALQGYNIASNVIYDNTDSDLSANRVQGAIDEIVDSTYTKTEVDSKLSAVYTPAGDIACAGLTSSLLDASHLNFVYNTSDSGTTTADFKEGAGHEIKVGSNVAVVNAGTNESPVYKFDLLTGIIDMSNYYTKTQVDTSLSGKEDKVAGKGLSTNDYTNEEKQKNADNASAIEDIQEDISQSLTATGNPLTIEAAEANLVECVAEVEAVQDLHGYDHPWVGGAWKNKLPMTVEGIKAANTSGTWSGNVYSINNGSFEILVDSDNNVVGIKVNGTFTAQTVFNYCNVLNNDYVGMKFNGNNSQAGQGDYSQIIIYTNSSGVWQSEAYQNSGNDVVIADYQKINVGFIVRNGKTVSNVAVYPMIRLSTETDSTFAPYTNVCPITGHTEASVQRTGLNWFDKSIIESGDRNKRVSTGNGGTYPADGYTSTKYMEIVGGETYRLSGGGNDFAYYFAIADENKRYIRGGSTTGSFTTTANEKYVKFDYPTDKEDNIQLELGTTATTYEPYKGKTYTIQIGQTVYGGQLDITRGKMVVNTKHVKVSDLTWNTQVGNYGRFTALVSDGYYSGSEVTVISSCYKSYSNEGSTHKPTNVDGIYIGGGVGNVQIKIYDIAYPNATDLSAWENARADCDIVYKLATPYTIQLTPQQIRLLKGTNHLSCNVKDLSIKYYPDNVLGQLKGDIENEYDDRIETLETQMVERPQLKRYSTRLLCDGFSSKNISITTDKKIIPLFARFDAEYMELYVDYEPRFYNPLVFYDDGTAYIEYQTSGIPNDNQQRTFEMYYYEV